MKHRGHFLVHGMPSVACQTTLRCHNRHVLACVDVVFKFMVQLQWIPIGLRFYPVILSCEFQFSRNFPIHARSHIKTFLNLAVSIFYID